MSRRIVCVIAVVGALFGCAVDHETRNLTETLSIAGTVGNAHQLALYMQQDLDAATNIADADKAELRARAQLLESHARTLKTSLDRYDPAGKQNPSISIGNLKARGEALDEEYRSAFREWGIWQVRHGLKAPEDVFLIFDHRTEFGE